MQTKQEAVHLTEKIDKQYALWLLHNVEQNKIKLLRGRVRVHASSRACTLLSSLKIQKNM